MDLLRTALSTREKLAYKPVVQLQRGKKEKKGKGGGKRVAKEFARNQKRKPLFLFRGARGRTK